MSGSMLGGGGGGFKVPALQADAVLSQANPVSGTKYLIAATKNMRVISIVVSVTWTVQPTPIEAHATIDTQALTFNKANPVSTQQEIAFISAYSAETTQQLFDATGTPGTDTPKAFLLEGRNVRIEAETTGGTVSSLDGRVKYGKW